MFAHSRKKNAQKSEDGSRHIQTKQQRQCRIAKTQKQTRDNAKQGILLAAEDIVSTAPTLDEVCRPAFTVPGAHAGPAGTGGCCGCCKVQRVQQGGDRCMAQKAQQGVVGASGTSKE